MPILKNLIFTAVPARGRRAKLIERLEEQKAFRPTPSALGQ
jgi:hypothetical protein